MFTLFPMVAAGMACLALGLALWQVGQKLKDLETKGLTGADLPPAGGTRSSGASPMLSALYQKEDAGALASVSGYPGAGWVIAGVLLALAAVLLSTVASPRAAEVARPVADSSIVQLRQRLDSLSLGLGLLRDSLRQAATRPEPEPNHARTPLAARPAGRGATVGNEIVPASPPPPTASVP